MCYYAQQPWFRFRSLRKNTSRISSRIWMFQEKCIDQPKAVGDLPSSALTESSLWQVGADTVKSTELGRLLRCRLRPPSMVFYQHQAPAKSLMLVCFQSSLCGELVLQANPIGICSPINQWSALLHTMWYAFLNIVNTYILVFIKSSVNRYGTNMCVICMRFALGTSIKTKFLPLFEGKVEVTKR